MPYLYMNSVLVIKLLTHLIYSGLYKFCFNSRLFLHYYGAGHSRVRDAGDLQFGISVECCFTGQHPECYLFQCVWIRRMDH